MTLLAGRLSCVTKCLLPSIGSEPIAFYTLLIIPVCWLLVERNACECVKNFALEWEETGCMLASPLLCFMLCIS